MTPEQLQHFNNETQQAEQAKAQRVRQQKAETLSRIGPVRELQSEYLGTNTYYYNESQDKIYSFDNYKGQLTNVSYNENEHLRKLNGLTPGTTFANIYQSFIGR